MPLRYAENFCLLTQVHNDSTKLKFSGYCVECGEPTAVVVLRAELDDYKSGRKNYVQEALKSNSPGEREFLMSGFCETCFDKSFGETNGIT